MDTITINEILDKEVTEDNYFVSMQDLITTCDQVNTYITTLKKRGEDPRPMQIMYYKLINKIKTIRNQIDCPLVF